MSVLSTIQKPQKRAPVITLLGEAGVGKTSLAALFPKPIFMRIEDGMQSISESHMPDAFPIIKDIDDIREQMWALLREEHEYKTLVIDSVTAMDRIFEKHIIDTDPRQSKSITTAMGGYGAGFKAVAILHGGIRKLAGHINIERGMNIVFLAHADRETIDPPDTESYSRYTLRMNSKSLPHYLDDVDLVGMIQLERYVKDDKAITSGRRIIKVTSSAASVTKNRYELTEDLIFDKGQNPFASILEEQH